ncbi:MAG: HIT domain-containing protein [Nitrospinales bacterium]
MQYIEQDKSVECIFCTCPKANEDDKNYILFKGPHCFVIMNIFPYNNGHLMVSPYRHVDCITKFDDSERDEMGKLTQICAQLLRTVYNPDGFNIGVNIGKTAGAGYDQHIHTHIVPRWNGDTNYMPVLAETKVHPEHLQNSYKRLSPYFKNIKL